MPTYEYKCKKCSSLWELRRSIAARDDAAPCPSCKSKSTMRMVVQKFGVIGGARPNAAMGEGEPEDFLDPDDFGHSHAGDHGGVDNWDDDF